MSITEDKFYNSREVADLLGLHLRTVQEKLQNGELPSYKFGKEYRIAKSDLEKWIEEHKLNPYKTEASAVVNHNDNLD